MALFPRRRETRPQVRISERAGVRYLHLDGPAVQSAMRMRAPLTLELEYTRAMMAFLLFRRMPRDITLIGLGGGSLAKFIHHHLDTARLTALEVLPEVVAAARAYFHLPEDDERLSVLTGDGAEYVRAHPDSLDVLLVDGYDAKRIVEDLASASFYRACRDMLRPGGVAVFNLWGSDAGFSRYFERIADTFGHHVLQLPAEKKGNIIVFAFRKPLPEVGFDALDAVAGELQATCGIEAATFIARMRAFNPTTNDGFLI